MVGPHSRPEIVLVKPTKYIVPKIFLADHFGRKNEGCWKLFRTSGNTEISILIKQEKHLKTSHLYLSWTQILCSTGEGSSSFPGLTEAFHLQCW